MKRYWMLVVLLAAGAALFLRLPYLERRPMHNDEAVNAIKFGRLWEGAGYKYDPNEHHGPTLYYATLALGRLTLAPNFDRYSDARLRLVTVLFGAGMLLLLPLVYDGLGRQGTAWAAVLFACSPAFVFYSRYFIHEMLLAFFTLLAIGAGWRYWRAPRLIWALLAGVSVGLMDATKETFALTVGAAALALLLNAAWARFLEPGSRQKCARTWNRWHLVAAFAAWLVVALLFFTSFFTNAAGPLDSLRSYQPWLNRAGGDSPHIHPWHFYLHRLLFFRAGAGPIWTEAPILMLAAVGAIAGFRRKGVADVSPAWITFLAFYSLILTAGYSVLGYKTPWCLLSFWQGIILLAGVGAAVLIGSTKPGLARAALTALLVAGAGHLAWQSWQLGTTYAADRRNPYVYAQTSADISKLVRRVEELVEVAPQGHNTLIKVICPEADYWPLPYYLRDCKQIGWWDALPPDPFAPLMIVSAQLHAALEEKKTHLMVGYFELRPQVFLELYVEKSLWIDWLAKHPPQTE